MRIDEALCVMLHDGVNCDGEGLGNGTALSMLCEYQYSRTSTGLGDVPIAACRREVGSCHGHGDSVLVPLIGCAAAGTRCAGAGARRRSRKDGKSQREDGRDEF